jgi:hypothetical protein
MGEQIGTTKLGSKAAAYRLSKRFSQWWRVDTT